MNKLLFILMAWFFATLAFATPVDINSADAKTIADALPGIGLKKAEAVVKYRTEKGAFKTADELENVAGIGKKTVEKIKQDVLLGDVAAAAATTAPTAPAVPVAKK